MEDGFQLAEFLAEEMAWRRVGLPWFCPTLINVIVTAQNVTFIWNKVSYADVVQDSLQASQPYFDTGCTMLNIISTHAPP